MKKRNSIQHTAWSRALMNRIVRSFFDSFGYLEVETPLLAPEIIPESTIPLFRTSYDSPHRDLLPLWLIPSPEVWMKQLLADGSGSIYQICKSFRNREALGNHHNPEFTMLEWYTVGSNYRDSMEVTEKLVLELHSQFPGSCAPDMPFPRKSVRELFLRYTGIDLERFSGEEAFRHEAVTRGYSVPADSSWEETFNRLFVLEVEPELTQFGYIFLFDYPEQVPVLARPCENGPWLQRWELYGNGIELANCFTEERDFRRVESFLVDEAETPGSDLPEVFMRLPDISAAMPECSGVAMGLDRLLMLLTGSERIQDVLLFSVYRDDSTML